MTKRKPIKKLSPLEPPDRERCQTLRPNGNTFMTLGGKPGLERCRNRPLMIATEVKPGADGRIGSMSVCGRCMVRMQEQLGVGYVKFSPVEEPS